MPAPLSHFAVASQPSSPPPLPPLCSMSPGRTVLLVWCFTALIPDVLTSWWDKSITEGDQGCAWCCLLVEFNMFLNGYMASFTSLRMCVFFTTILCQWYSCGGNQSCDLIDVTAPRWWHNWTGSCSWTYRTTLREPKSCGISKLSVLPHQDLLFFPPAK